MSALKRALTDPQVRQQFAALTPEQRIAFEWRARWLGLQALEHQLEPLGDWSIWLLLGGRGAGKTRTAAETLGWWAWEMPESRWLVSAPTSGDLRGTCFEGDSGLLNVIPKALIADYNKSLHEITLVNGSLIKGIPASEPERFRGPQFHGGWCCIPGTQILTPAGARPIEGIRAGDLVLTRHGARRVQVSGVSGNTNALVRIEAGDTSLTVTADHPILVGDQWIPAGDLKQGDLVWQAATNTSADGTRTESFTKGATATSRPDGWCITKTKTRETTIPRTSKQCREARTYPCIKSDGWRANGNGVLRRKLWQLCASLNPQRAFNAAGALFRFLRARWVNSAVWGAGRNGVETYLCLNKGTAKFADHPIKPSSGSSAIAASDVTADPKCAPIALRQTVVRRVEKLPNSLTYNLTVEGEHEFFANGIVVHNCDELAAWDYLQDSWDMIQFGVRLGKRTRILASTTPKPKAVILDLIARDGDDVVVTRASTYANIANLAPSFQKQILQYEGTKLGRQEIHAEIIDPEEGGIVKREWFRLWPAGRELPKFEFVLQSYDCANTDKTHNDPTAAITFGVFKPEDGGMCVLVVDCWQDHLQYPDLRPKVIAEFETVYGDGKTKKRVDLILVEDKSAGISLIQDLQQAHLPVHAYNPGRADKIQRLSIVANIIKAGRVWVPESTARAGFVRDWAEGMVSQVCGFPEGVEHDDFVDAISQALRYLRDAGWISIDVPRAEYYDDDDYFDAEEANKKYRDNPYSA